MIESLLNKKNLIILPNEILEELITESIKACHMFSLTKSWSIVYQKTFELVLEKREKT